MSEMPERQDVQLVIHSGALFSGVMKGFGLIFTEDRVIGSKDFTEDHFIEAAPLSDDGLKKVVSLLKHKQFEVLYSDLQSVEVKSPGKFKPGAFVFHATSGDEQVKIGGTFGSRFSGVKDIGEIVSDVLEKFVPGKVTR
ncbi:MAG: hypothetical protein IVW53_04295 [Chloroflexi bacterium]|nr:hypothetical protein [Chloroflexota bacterium]